MPLWLWGMPVDGSAQGVETIREEGDVSKWEGYVNPKQSVKIHFLQSFLQFYLSLAFTTLPLCSLALQSGCAAVCTTSGWALRRSSESCGASRGCRGAHTQLGCWGHQHPRSVLVGGHQGVSSGCNSATL